MSTSLKRGSGILLHLSSLPSRYGIGDMGDHAHRFVDRLAESGQRYWQLLPLNPTAAIGGHSPYFSNSAFAGNPLFISPDLLVRDGFLDSADLADAPSFPDDSVDYDAVVGYRTGILLKAYRCFASSTPPAEYKKFCSEQSRWLDDYALFKALSEHYGKVGWDQWPGALRDRHPRELAKARKSLAEPIAHAKFNQYVFFSQWFTLKAYANSKGVEIVGDLPIYVSYDSADVWANPGIFKLNEDKRPTGVSGVPPDYFSATGQLWGNPVYDWEALAAGGYEWWKRRMRATLSRFDTVRIDHFRGLVQFWEVPAGEKTAMNGTWSDVPTHEFFDALIKDVPDFRVIAEDLGIITDDVREAMAHYGLPGMNVLLFAFSDDPTNSYLPHNFERNSIVYTGTHDNNTCRGWFQSEVTRKDRRQISAYLGKRVRVDTIAWDLIRLAMMSVGNVVIVPLQDLLGLGSEARMNTPSQAGGNWRWRCSDGQFGDIPWDDLRKLSHMSARVESSKGTAKS